MRIIFLEIFIIVRTKRIILVIFLKVGLIILVIHIRLITSIFNSKAHNNYSFKFLSIRISIIAIYKLINIIIAGI